MISKIFNRKNLSLVISVGSATWSYLRKILVYGSRYAGGILAVGAIGASAVAVGKSLDSDNQLKLLQIAVNSQNSELISTIEKANQANEGLSNMASSITGTLDEVSKKQNNLEDNVSRQDTAITQQSQTLQQLNSKTIKALADLSVVNQKIVDANTTLSNLTAKSEKIVNDLTNASAELMAKNDAQDVHVDDNLKAIDTSFQNLYGADILANTQIADISTSIDSIKTDIDNLKLQNSTTSSDIQNLQTVVSMNTSDILTNKNLNDSENATQNTTISNQGIANTAQDALLSGFSATLNSKITAYDLHFTQNDNAIARIGTKIHSGVFDDGGLKHGTVTFPSMSAPPIIVANMSNTSGDGYIRIDSVTNSSFDYTIIGNPTFGDKVFWIATIF